MPIQKTHLQRHPRTRRKNRPCSPLFIRIGSFTWLSCIVILLNMLHVKVANHTSTISLIRMTVQDQHAMMMAVGSNPELQELHSLQHYSINGPPIFVMGLPGSGLDALHHFFNCSGLRVQYDPDCGQECQGKTPKNESLFHCMIQNRERQMPVMNGCENWMDRGHGGGEPFHVLSSFCGMTSSGGFFLPQHYHLRELHEYSPNATWLLPLVNATVWTARSHYKIAWRRRFMNEFSRYNNPPADYWTNATTAEMADIQFMAELYDNHTEKVRDFCRQHPSHKLVEFNLMDGSAGAAVEAILKHKFGLDSSTSCWKDPVDDITPNHLHGIVKQTIEARSHDISPKLPLPLPIIVVGYPKSGTTSVSSFFRCAGIMAQHYCCCGDVSDRPPCYTNATMAECISNNLNNKRPILEGCGDYPVYAQLDGEMKSSGINHIPMSHFLPQHFHLDELHDYDPNATYVLPLRDAMAWAESVINWFNMRKRLVSAYRLHQIPQAFDVMKPKKNITRMREFLRDIYMNHTETIRQFVRQHPSHTLVEFDIAQPNAGTIMSQAFGLPSECWNHENKNNKKNLNSSP
jgi:Sulfotransferase domain